MPTPKKPSFADALQQVVTVKAGELKVDTILDQLKPDDQRAALGALLDPSVPHQTLARAFSAMGHDVGSSAIKTWRERPNTRKERNL